MNYKEVLENRRSQRLKDKYTSKAYHEAWRPLRHVVLPTSYLIQIVTAVLACAVPAWAVEVLTGSWVAGFIVGAVFMFFVEFMKRTIVENTTLHYFQKGRLSVTGGLAVLLFLGLSMASSGIGTPILVENFAPMPSKPIESEINKPYEDRKQAAALHWEAVKSEALDKAKEVHSKNNWKGVTVKGARATVLAFNQQAKAATDSLNSHLATIEEQRLKANSEALAAFVAASISRTKQKTDLGFYLMFVTLFFELCFIACYAWLNYYDFREATKLGLVTVQSAKQVKDSRRETPVNTELQKQSKAKQVEQVPNQRTQSIGFTNEGKIVTTGKKLSIICRTYKGDLKPYDSSKLSTIIRQGGSRVSYWQDMKNKLDNAK